MLRGRRDSHQTGGNSAPASAIPDLNEMRYAGYYALRYAELPAGDKRDKECRKRVRQGVNRFLARSRKYG